MSALSLQGIPLGVLPSVTRPEVVAFVRTMLRHCDYPFPHSLTRHPVHVVPEGRPGLAACVHALLRFYVLAKRLLRRLARARAARRVQAVWRAVAHDPTTVVCRRLLAADWQRVVSEALC